MIAFRVSNSARPGRTLVRLGSILLGAGLVGAIPTGRALAEAAPPIEEVVVTGSRIERSNATSNQPISTISGEDIARTGRQDLGEILNDNPAMLSSVTASNSLDFEPNNVAEADNIGGSALDLRGLGYQRTLTLVNGRRHVSGIEGTSSVDVSTIPSALIEQVEVLTGGASAIYGADAVTGVVNFILKDDFEGLELDFKPGISSEGDGESTSLSAVFGKNFNDGRGNVTFALQHDYTKGLRAGDRSYLSGDGMYNNDTNPQLRFQNGDITAADTPNFSQYYNFDNTGLFPVGLRIPTAEDFALDYEGAFGSAPNLTAAEQALMQRAASAYPQAFLPGHTYNITSPYGVVALGDFGVGATPLGSEPDLNGNGVPDCLDSFTGYNSSLAGAGSFGAAGGCWFIDQNGNPQPYADGQVADNFNQFGASQSYIAPDRPYVLPKEKRYAVNFNGRYEFTEQAEAFFETKYVYQEVTFGGDGHNYTDLLYGAPDNPYLPEALAPYAVNDGISWVGPGGLYMSRDSDDWGSNESTNERETYRFVGGLRGNFESLNLSYEVSANYGRFERKLIDREDMIADRFFAAIDVVTDPATGNPVCRSDLDPTAYPQTTPFDIFSFVGGGVPSSFFTFTPGDGQCKPANIWGGRGAMSQESIDFMTYTRHVKEKIEQTVFSGYVSGDTELLFSLPAGPISFAVGGEWREEKSAQTYDEYDRGIIQVDGVTSDGVAFSAGDYVGDVSAAGSLGEDPSLALLSGSASYDVWDVFAEVSVPVLADVPGAQELTVDGAIRRADYSTFGTNTTWSVGGLYAPVEDVRFRGSYNEAVRVPNIFELYSPDQGAFFRPQDPCDATQIGLSTNPAQRQANCIADLQSLGVANGNIFDAQGNYAFQDPLSAGFPGVVGGNPELEPETAKTVTYGFVLQPRFLEGLTLTWDYWDIEIDQAIASISAQNIVDSCYDQVSLANPFCDLIERNPDPTSAQSGGLTFLRQAQLNFGAAEASGWDMSLIYDFFISDFQFQFNGVVTKQTKLDFIEPSNPGEPPTVDDELGEMRRPEWASQVALNMWTGPISLTWQTQYLSKQVLGYEDGGEIETVDDNYGPDGYTDDIFIHNMHASYQATDSILIYGGIDNVTNERPFVTERAYPVSPLGRYFFAGINVRLF